MVWRRRDVLKTGSAMVDAAGIPSLGLAQGTPAATGSLEIDTAGQTTPISPLIFGQFIEFLGRSITGGIFEEGSPLSDENGFRRDVLAKVQGLQPTILRFPGGTVTKIYHWEDGIGPRSQRRARPNLIWGGVEDNHFGTDEFIRYARALKAEPFITVSMGVGTAEEASNWVEYCNGTAATHYADLRRRHGFAEPYAVKYWGLGNEEDAEPDAGRLQDPADYSREAWYYAKLMKLQDPTIKLIAAGGGRAWNERVIHDLHPVADYLALHLYPKTQGGVPLSLIKSADDTEATIGTIRNQIATLAPPRVTEFNKWYRFPPRKAPMMIALDEIGIWEDAGAGVYNMETRYDWNHALATATLYNVMIRNADIIGMATWAQTVNVLAPILTNATGSIAQTIWFVMALYRRFCGSHRLAVTLPSPVLALPGAEQQRCLDTSATIDEASGTISVFVVNRHPDRAITTRIARPAGYARVELHELSAPSSRSANTLDRPTENVVAERSRSLRTIPDRYSFPAHSVTVLRFQR